VIGTLRHGCRDLRPHAHTALRCAALRSSGPGCRSRSVALGAAPALIGLTSAALARDVVEELHLQVLGRLQVRACGVVAGRDGRVHVDHLPRRRARPSAHRLRARCPTPRRQLERQRPAPDAPEASASTEG